MPMIRKLIKVGDSRVVSIPRDWLNYYKKTTGKEIEEVLLEVNGEIKVKPYIENRKEG
jgi:antitoxin component of MazEF toxin-antitoxin module